MWWRFQPVSSLLTAHARLIGRSFLCEILRSEIIGVCDDVAYGRVQYEVPTTSLYKAFLCIRVRIHGEHWRAISYVFTISFPTLCFLCRLTPFGSKLWGWLILSKQSSEMYRMWTELPRGSLTGYVKCTAPSLCKFHPRIIKITHKVRSQDGFACPTINHPCLLSFVGHRQIRMICRHLHQSLSSKFPDSIHSVLGGYIFLRLICPVSIIICSVKNAHFNI